MTNKSITLNVWKDNNEFAMAIQGEVNSRFLIVKLIDDSGPLDLTNKSVKFLAKKPDGTVIFNNMDIENAQNGVAILALTSQMSAVPGFLDSCEIQIISENGDTLIAKKINIMVQPSLGASIEESISETTAYQELINKVNLLEAHSIDKNNPHNVSPEQIGAASNDIVTTSSNGIMSFYDKIKLDNIEDGAKANVQPDWNQTDSTADDYIKNKPSFSSDLEGVLPIEKGGTGASTLTGAQNALKIYTNVEQLGLSYPTTTKEIFEAMPAGSIGNFSFESKSSSIKDAPLSYGIYSIFYPSDNSRPLLFCTQCISTGSDYSAFFVGYYEIAPPKSIKWYRVFNGSMIATISHGGTGAKTAENALLNLGAAKSSDIGDITTLSTTNKTVVGAINELYNLITNTN